MPDTWLSDEELGVSTSKTQSLEDTDLAGFHAKRTGMPRELIAAVIRQESNNNPAAVNPEAIPVKGGGSEHASGLMQLLPSTAASLGVTGNDIFDEKKNARAGVDYLYQGYKKYGGDVAKAAKYFFAGPNEKLWGPKTERYAQEVQQKMAAIKGPDSAKTQGDQWLPDEELGISTQAKPPQEPQGWSLADNLMESAKGIFNDKIQGPGQEPRDDQYPESSYGGQQPRPPEDLSKPSFARSFAGARRTNPGASSDLGSIPALIDLFVSPAGMAAHAGAYFGQRDLNIVSGMPNEYGGQVAKEVADQLIPDAVMTPMRKLMYAMDEQFGTGAGRAYDKSMVSRAMQVVGKQIEEGTAGVNKVTGEFIQPEDLQEAANLLMAFGGAKAGDVAIKRAADAKEAVLTERAKAQVDEHYPITDPDAMPGVVRTGRRVPEDVPAIVRRREGMFQNGTTGKVDPRVLEAVSQRSGAAPEEIKSIFDQAVDPADPKAAHEQIIQYVKDHPELQGQVATGAAVVAAGGWLYMNPEDADKIGLTGLAMAGAVKGKGGMWHPEAVRKLSEPLSGGRIFDAAREQGIIRTPEEQAAYEQTVARRLPIIAWSDSRVKSYLNKHAGTEGDPLRTVEFPMLGDGVTFGDAMDQIIKSEPARNYQRTSVMQTGDFSGYAVYDDTKAAKKLSPVFESSDEARDWQRVHQDKYTKDFSAAKPEEQIYHIPEVYADEPGQWVARATRNSVSDVLSHVGDYLREFVPPEKLQQYDLVRAVKETAENDRKAALELAKGREEKLKASAQITSELPPSAKVKTYDDGSAWYKIDNTLPEEQIKLNMSIDTELCALCIAGVAHGKWGYEGYVPSRNIVTRKKTHPNAEETTHYMDAVINGQQEVYSLRKPNGEVGATINVLLNKPKADNPAGWYHHIADPEVRDSLPHSPGNDLNNAISRWTETIRQDPRYQEYVKMIEQLPAKSKDIQQIKGMENQTLVGTPFEKAGQDFVKSGKWGDVGDLENTGLVRAGNEYINTSGMEFTNRVNDFYDHLDRIGLSGNYPQPHRVLSSPSRYGDVLEEMLKWEQKPDIFRRAQLGESGSVDPKLLGAVAGASVGIYADPDHKLMAGAIGALAGLALASKFGRNTPAVKSVEKGYKASIEQVQRKVNPDALGPKAEQSAAILASHYVQQMQKEIFQGKLGKDRQAFFERLPEEKRVAFLKGLETPGVKYKDPIMQKLREGYKDWNNKIFEQDKKNGIEYTPEDNYISHVFEEPDKIAEFLQQKYGKKWGDPGFTKDRTFKTISEAEKEGFKLKYTNPEQIMQARQVASDIAQMKVNALRDLAENGLARRVTKGMSAKPNEATWRSPNGELYFLTDHANQVMHNAFNTKSLWDDAGMLGMSYRGAMWTKNAILPFKLLSGFHALHIALGMNLGTTAVNTIKGLAAGNKGFGSAMLDIGKSVLLLDSLRQSQYVARKMQPHSMRAFRGDIPPEKITELDKQQMQNAYDGGFSPEMSEEYRNQSIKDFSSAIARKSLTAVWHAPFALMEAAWTRPMFQNWIPAVKWEAFQKTAAAHLAANPELAGNSLARRVALRKISKMIDDRFGEVQYKTLFMDRVVKDIGVASFLSYGWQLGFVRSYLGAFPEAARAFTKMEGKSNLSLKDAIRQGKLDKTLFLQNYITGTMLYGGLMTYALTGELPRTILDYIYPRSGDKNKDGTDARISTPFYTREFVQVPSHIAKEGVVGGLATTVGGKLNPMIGLIKGIVLNKDYFDKQLYKPDDDTMTKVQKKSAWLLGELEPMAANRPKNAPDTTKSKVLAAAGFNPAPKYVTHPKDDREWITVPKRSKK